MRILIWTDGFWPEIGGLEVFCMHLVKRLRKSGHDCLIIAERNGAAGWGMSDYHGTPVYGVTFCKTTVKRDLVSLREQHEACKSLIAQFDPEVIHLNTVMRGVWGFLLQQRDQRRPTVMTLHDYAIFQHRNALATALLEHVDSLAAVSDFIRVHALENRPELKNKLRTVLNALPMPDLPPSPLPAERRVLAFGRFTRDKGFDLAIQAFAGVAPRFPEATLTLAGNGMEFDALQKLAVETGFGDRIHFPGWVNPEDIPALINQHTLVVMPARWQEPFGLVVLQTAQMGRPVIASRMGGIPEIVVDGVTGKLFESDNVPELTKTLQLLLEDPALCEEMGRNAHSHARQYFRFDHFVAAYERMYEQAASAIRA
jgi:glycogen(starch) synthase